MISSWVEPFHEFVNTYHEIDFYNETLNDYDFRFYLSQFLHTHSGGKFRANFRFKTKLECGEPVPDIMVSTIDFKYKRLEGRNNYLPAMHTIEHMVENSQLTSGDGFATVWGRIYGNWVTDEVILFTFGLTNASLNFALLSGDRHRSFTKYYARTGMCHVLHNHTNFKSKCLFLDFLVCRAHTGKC